MFVKFGASLACEKVWVFSGSAGAIYVFYNFAQSSGTLTITNSSAERSGGVVWWTWELLRGGIFGDVI